MFVSLLNRLRWGFAAKRPEKPKHQRVCRGFTPRLEPLEDRTVPSTLTVQNTADSGTGSLRTVIGAVHNGDTIVFAQGVHGTITLTSGDLPIDVSVSIEGPGANHLSISGNNTSRIFDISGSASVSITGLTITKGLANSGGGILLEDSSALSLNNCTLNDNEALGNAGGGGLGGGIEDNSSGALTITNSTFDANSAVGVGPNDSVISPTYILALGGGIDVGGLAGLTGITGSVTVSNSTFAGNQALGGSPGASAGGGALSNSNGVNGGTMTVTDCTLSDNAAIGSAGGDGINNFGSGQGGGINNFANLVVYDSNIRDNLALGTPLAAGAVPSQTPSSGSATAGGGIFCLTIFLPTASVTVADSTISGNQAVGGAGAANSAGSVAEGGGISLILVPSASVSGCTVADNVAQGGAGGSAAVGGPGVSGGIDLAFGSVVTVSDTTIIGNQAIGGAGGSGANGLGGGGEGVGGGINVGTGVIVGAPDNCSLTLTDSILIGNQAVGGSGGSGSEGGNGLGGGLSVLAGSSASIDASLILVNTALGGNSGKGGNSGQGFGGGLYIEAGASVMLNNPGEVFLNYASTSNDDVFGSYTS